MEIRDPLYSPYSPAAHDPSTQRHHHSPNSQNAEHSGQQTRAIRTVSPGKQVDYESNSGQSRRVVNRDVELPRSSQQALGHYESTDLAGGPELLNRVDVFV